MKQAGSSLLEVLVAMFVLGVGMLGVFSMQAQTSRYNHSAYYYSRAVMLAHDMAENVRTTPSLAGSYRLLLSDPTPDARNCQSFANPCSGNELVSWHLNNWRTAVTQQLPSGNSEIMANGDQITIKIQFDDSRAEPNKDKTADEQLSEYVLVTEV